MLSAPAVPLVSLSDARSLFNVASETLLMNRSVVPLLAAVAPAADSNPLLSFSSTEKVSPLAASISVTAPTAIVVALLIPIVCVVVARSTGHPRARPSPPRRPSTLCCPSAPPRRSRHWRRQFPSRRQRRSSWPY